MGYGPEVHARHRLWGIHSVPGRCYGTDTELCMSSMCQLCVTGTLGEHSRMGPYCRGRGLECPLAWPAGGRCSGDLTCPWAGVWELLVASS